MCLTRIAHAHEWHNFAMQSLFQLDIYICIYTKHTTGSEECLFYWDSTKHAPFQGRPVFSSNKHLNYKQWRKPNHSAFTCVRWDVLIGSSIDLKTILVHFASHSVTHVLFVYILSCLLLKSKELSPCFCFVYLLVFVLLLFQFYFVKMLFCQRYLFHVQVSLQSDSSTNIWWSLQENIRGVSSELVNLKLNQEKGFVVLLLKEEREDIIFSMEFGVDLKCHI